MISLRARALSAAIRIYTYPYRKRHMSLSRNIKIKSNKYRPPKDLVYRTDMYNGVKFEIIASVQNSASRYCIMHFHGGGHTVGMNNFNRKTAERYARLTRYTVFSVDYRYGEQLRHPALLDECYNAYIGLISDGVQPDNIIAVGDSFGADIMLGVFLKLRDNGIVLPRGLVAISPFIDFTAGGLSYHVNCYNDPMYSLPKKQKYSDNIENIKRINPYGSGCDLTNPYLSPAFGEFNGFPPMLIQCGSYETSKSDAITLYCKALKVGIDVQFTEYYGMFHNFQYMVPSLKESKAAWKEIANFIKDLTQS